MFTITADDHGGVIVVVGCILMTWTLLCFMIRMYNRFTIRASLGLDDFACALATVRAQFKLQADSTLHSNINQAVGVAQTLMMCVAVSYGFGKSHALSSTTKARSAEKACRGVGLEHDDLLLTILRYMYAVAVISLCEIAFSKAAILFFHLRITPRRPQRIACYILAGVCGLWIIIVATLIGTRCGKRTPCILYGRTYHSFVSRRDRRRQPHTHC